MEGDLSWRKYLPHHFCEKQLTGLNAGAGEMLFSAPSSAPLLLAIIGMEKHFLKRKESISTKDKSSFNFFFFFQYQRGSTASQPANIHLQASSVWAICKPSLLPPWRIAVDYSLFHFDISH